MIQREIMVEALQRAYPQLSLSSSAASMFLEKMIKGNKVICEREGFAMYMKCSDEVLDRISKEPGYILDPIKAQELLDSKGDNVHIFAIISIKNNKQGKRYILQGIKDLITKERPKTISWYNKTMNKFNLRRTQCQ